ncbi:GNAT family N-acetyltransferase [Candidatus Parcubacteria bacterium]|jgi:hypothetical protein|nr:GNAT family N-acetyltransferase [Candidatus Parcubacteria bacterium]
MEVINYKIDGLLSDYSDLIVDIYRDYPDVARTKVEEARKINNISNPFFNFGSVDNFLLLDQGKPVAHAAVITDSRLPAELALLGCFESKNNQVYADKIFDAISEHARQLGRKILRGPINLTTWQNWRVSFPEDRQPFSLEPFCRAYYKDLFENANFEIAQQNVSTISSLKDCGFTNFAQDFSEVVANGFVFEHINEKNYQASLQAIFQMISEVFVDSWSFAKISLEEFAHYYKDLDRTSTLPFSCLVLDKKKCAAAFCFAVADVSDSDRVIIKTFAVGSKFQGQAIGKAMFYWVYQQAKKQNVKEFIFSTMREDNQGILNLTKGADIYRYYRAYQKQI